jgi:hypothetical protein
LRSEELLRTRAILFLVTLLLQPPGAAAGEARCTALGAACHCSEPLDNEDAYAPSPSACCHDPSDSDTQECMPGNYSWDSNSDDVSGRRPLVAFPKSATVSHVLHRPNDSGIGRIWGAHEGTDFDATGKTLCTRHYVNYGSSHSGPGNLKIARSGHANWPAGSAAWQMAWDSGFSGEPNCGNPPAAAGNRNAVPSISWLQTNGPGEGAIGCKLDGSGDLVFSDCQSHWCRIEACWDHDAATGKMSLRGRVVQVGGAKSRVLFVGSSCRNAPGFDDTVAKIAFHGGMQVEVEGTCPPATVGGPVDLSHALFVVTDYDSGFWPGQAWEIEGAPAPPPPAPSDAPPAAQ